jgi:hypothetical protein
MRPEPATLDWVVAELARLDDAGLRPVLFGGWAKQLHGAWPPAPHGDLDVLVHAGSPAPIDAYIAARGADAYAPKAHPHKRAYVADGHLVELFAVGGSPDAPVTDFYGHYARPWPTPLATAHTLPGGRTIQLASAPVIAGYEADHHRIQDALHCATPGLRDELIARYGTPYAPCRHPLHHEETRP